MINRAGTARVAPATAFAVAMLGIALFSVMDAVMKGLSLDIGAYNAMFWRSLIGTAIAAPLYLRRRTWPDRARLRVHGERGLVSAGMALLFFWGMARVPMAQAVALTFIAPLIALFLAAALLSEKIDRRAIIASLIAFAGVLTILAGQARAQMGHEALIGAVAILVSAVFYAYNIVLMRRQALLADPIEVAFFQNLCVAAPLACAAPFLMVTPDAVTLPHLLLAALLANGSLLLLSWAYARAEAGYLATVEYSAFLWASLLGYLVFGETVGLLTIAGAVLIAGGCLAAARRRIDPMANLESAT